MAESRSLGVHTPAGLQYLIDEGLLPAEPRRDAYEWDTYLVDDGLEHEILATKKVVVWSRGGLVRQIFRFELEEDDVTKAVLTAFPTADAEKRQALVVFLKTKAHIHFLPGSHHIVNLPFEVERAFPALRGLVIQRKPDPIAVVPPTPRQPVAPQNSLWSSQLQPSSSYSLHSPNLRASYAAAHPAKRSPLGGSTVAGLDALFDELTRNTGSADDSDETPRLYTLTNPLEEIGALSSAVQTHKPRLSGRGQSATNTEFEMLDQAEEILYVSANDELPDPLNSQRAPLMLIVTANRDLNVINLWHAYYIEPKSLASLLKQRAASKAAKVRRRSSFMSTIGTGATTPAIRHRDGTRESFVGELMLPNEPAASQSIARKTRRKTRQEEEEQMASQMDPDYEPSQSQRSERESRRISSLVSRGDLAATDTGKITSFSATGRRGPSFGGLVDRKSFGHRKSRGSTPGSSIFSRSIGGDEDLDMSLDGDQEGESIESIVKLIRAAHDAAAADNVFSGNDYKQECVVRKICSIPFSGSSAASSLTTICKVVTLAETNGSTEREARLVNVYIQDPASSNLQCLQLHVHQRSVYPGRSAGLQIAIPTLWNHQQLGKCTDLSQLQDANIRAVLLAGRGIILSPESAPISLPLSVPHRMFDQYDVLSHFEQANRDVGKNRILPGPGKDILLQHTGAYATFDEVGEDHVHHRRAVRLRPRDPFVDRVIDVCDFALPETGIGGRVIRRLWCICSAWLVHHPTSVQGTACDKDWVAMFMAICCFVSPSITVSRATARAPIPPHAVLNDGVRRKRKQLEAKLFASPAWSWMESEKPSISPSEAKDEFPALCSALASKVLPMLDANGLEWLTKPESAERRLVCIERVIVALHLFREEQKLYTLSTMGRELVPMIAQIGRWVSCEKWAYNMGSYYELEGGGEVHWNYVKSKVWTSQLLLTLQPLPIFEWLELAIKGQTVEQYPSLVTLFLLDGQMDVPNGVSQRAAALTPRTSALSAVLAAEPSLSAPAVDIVELMSKHGVGQDVLETLPEAVAAPFRNSIASCERDPPTDWSLERLQLVGREDLDHLAVNHGGDMDEAPFSNSAPAPPRDVQTICNSTDQPSQNTRTREADRHAVSALAFREDRRLVEATNMMHYNSMQVAECPTQPDWSEAHHLDEQRRLMHWVTIRMIALPAGDGMIHFDSQMPLLTEKYQLSGFNNSCLMKPMNNTVTTDRTWLTEEKVSWAYFHAGVSAGLRISHNVTGIDTTWVIFNKPNELTNRHAGLLLALGINGHLKTLAKWLSFKYLTPKHTMTSVGLLLGLSASHMGTMDSLVTRMLSVHVTCMLPPGAAELNVSPISQTAGLMGVGLLYYNTQHRRMSEIMLSQIEHFEIDDPDTGPDHLRDESYRLAAGFALGLINLAKGKDLRGLHGTNLLERLLLVAVGPRPVSVVHIFDQATAGAIVAIALTYMKSGDRAVARKIDIPDTAAQYDHMRPDMLMLRTAAKHLVLWDDVKARGLETDDTGHNRPAWIRDQIPSWWREEFFWFSQGHRSLGSEDVPYFYIITGAAWALSLKYAGTGNEAARNELCCLLQFFHNNRGLHAADRYFYDAKLTVVTIRRCTDVIALAAATVMAGTGDLHTFRHLRRLHGRTDPDTPYGSHLAAHLAIGVLFMGGGTYTLGTSDLAVASMMLSFYPLFPTDVQDNRVHLQAFRHFWVFAAEARCIVVRDIDTHRPISMPMQVVMRDGSLKKMTAPCLLPELETIISIRTDDPAYWRVTLDFSGSMQHLEHFKRNQTVYVRRAPASEAHAHVFGSTLAALHEAAQSKQASQWQWIFTLPEFRDFDQADVELALSEMGSHRIAKIDDQLMLARSVDSNTSDRDALWNLRLLFAWAEKSNEVKWLHGDFIQGLRAKIMERARAAAQA